MYLTQLQLDPRSAQARRDLADAYDMHRTLVRAFVQDETQAPPRFLWRLEPDRTLSRPTVLVQSLQTGDWAFLERLAGYLAGEGARRTKSFEPDTLLQDGARYRFRLVANPTVTRGGKRHGLVGEEAQLAWLTRQGERAGFNVLAAVVAGDDRVRSRRGGEQISLSRVGFEGVLEARDKGLLGQALAAGIGPGKAFGCGLLSLARLR
jgi:CRISPR system Cascade subunit CasE